MQEHPIASLFEGQVVESAHADGSGFHFNSGPRQQYRAAQRPAVKPEREQTVIEFLHSVPFITIDGWLVNPLVWYGHQSGRVYREYRLCRCMSCGERIEPGTFRLVSRTWDCCSGDFARVCVICGDLRRPAQEGQVAA